MMKFIRLRFVLHPKYQAFVLQLKMKHIKYLEQELKTYALSNLKLNLFSFNFLSKQQETPICRKALSGFTSLYTNCSVDHKI